MKHVSLLGSDCLKDIFAFHKEQAEFEIDAFVQNCNPLSAVLQSPLEKPLDAQAETFFADSSKFLQRCATQDAGKGVFRYFSEFPSDWILLDFSDVRRDLYVTRRGGGTHWYPEALQALRQAGYLADYQVFPVSKFDQTRFLSVIEVFLKQILRQYPERNIVLVDLRGTTRLVNQETGRSGYLDQENVAAANDLAARAFRHAAEFLPECHVIPFPEDTPADWNHKWGRSPWHFVREYYEYAYQAMRVIAAGDCDLAEERRRIEALRDEYRAAMHDRYADYDRNKIAQLNRDVTTYKRFKSYEQYFKKILVRDKREALISFFTREDQRVAIWGLNENTKLFLDLLGERKDRIAYIVHNSREAAYQGVPLISEQAAEFPPADCMVIADLGYQKLRPRLEAMGCWSTVTDYEELIR